MTEIRNRNVVVLAALGAEPAELMSVLGAHPLIDAPPAVRLSALFHSASRELLRMARRADAEPRDRTNEQEAISQARVSCTAALSAVFDEVRARSGARVVVLWDPDRMTFPFSEVSELDVIILRPGSRMDWTSAVPGVLESHLAALVRHDIEGLLHRIRVWGLSEDRVFTVLQDEVGTEEGCRGLLNFLGADASDATIGRLLTRKSAGYFAAD